MRILLIQIDDVGASLLASTYTPNIDRLLSEGDVCGRFVAAPNCSNFRAKVETGLYSVREKNGVGGIFNKTTDTSLPVLGETTLANVIHSRGKRSAQVGKWHLCAQEHLDHRKDAGYADSAGSQANLGPGSYESWTANINGTLCQIDEDATEWTARRAMEHLHDEVLDFVNVGFNAAHKPWGKRTASELLGALDYELGYLLGRARTEGWGVILVSDNGGGKAEGGKGNLSHKALATLCVTWRLPVYTRQLVDATDLYATIIHGVTGCVPYGCDGMSLFAPEERMVAFADLFPGVEGRSGEGQEMATDGIIKVIRDIGTGEVTEALWDDSPMPPEDSTASLIAALDAR